jgi:GTPase SAR1 family protein
MCSHERIKEQLENPKYYQIHQFTFDYVCDERSDQKEVYGVAAEQAIESCFQGFNASIMAYGQTGTGKTYTMEGFSDYRSEKTGIFPRAVLGIFDQIDKGNVSGVKSIKISYLQIYNENLSDLLKPERVGLKIKQDKKRGIHVEGISEWQVTNPDEVFALIERGGMSRPTANTKMNELSSRSHALFIITIEKVEEANGYKTTQVGKLNFVDLAGSERLRVTGATGKRLEECKKINKSLAALGNVISALSSRQNRSHIPYRNSKLTRLLEDS